MEFCDEVSLSPIEMGFLGWYLCLDRRGKQLAVLPSLSLGLWLVYPFSLFLTEAAPHE